MAVSPRGVDLAIWIAVFTLLTTLILSLRFWAIAITRRPLLAHDWLVTIAYFSTCCMAGVCWWAIANRLGAHTNTLSAYELHCLLQTIDSIPYASLFPSRGFTRMLWTTAACVVAYFVSFLPIFLTQCHPVSFGWNPVQGGYCRSLYIQEILSISINMIIDTGIALLPIPALWKLKMATRNKLTISIMFGLGLIVVAVMALRLRITLDPTTNLDFVYGLYPVALVSFLELWLSMIIVCLPVLAPLYRRYIEPCLYRIIGSSGNAEAPLEAPLQEAQHTFGSEPVHHRRRVAVFGDKASGHSSSSQACMILDTQRGYRLLE
ncbi:hypothetical protein BP00DRAFT_486485 [Aspergillus indologenus CBS 114.80]|uniref:Rhodopsin domain-containing protein n=1 Tax=Aspergillus indologenus CBS 114.80 TaxID=1450541 RepID=A0A2V5I722_9EURO|nr:hypothetical protein BP00DRAFT_486485 [Aspergillus indologenus CBS 114.80]